MNCNIKITRCIFCKQPSESSIAIEHIVPESLGNKEHVLPKGIVCDKCNNYFATKVEKKVLETKFFRNLRFRTELESKKGHIPHGTTLFPKTGYKGEIRFDDSGLQSKINIVVDDDTFQQIQSGKIKQVYLPTSLEFPKGDQAVSRLLAKISFEFLAAKFLNNPEHLEGFIDEKQLNPLREYARFNHKNETWIYHVRKIYREDEKFHLEDGKSVDMVFECDFLVTGLFEIYFVIAFKGIEFVLNMAGSSIDGYLDWLILNNNISPLYRQGSNFGYKINHEFSTSDDDNSREGS